MDRNQAAGPYYGQVMTKEELLKASHTRLLLKKIREYYGPEYGYDSVLLERAVKGGSIICHEYTREEIRAELALRPHIPNKNESRGLRLQKIRASK